MNIASTVDQPFTNANCASVIVLFSLQNFSIRLFNTEVNNFERQLTKVIPL